MYKSRYGKDVNEGCEVQLKTPKFSKSGSHVRMLINTKMSLALQRELKAS